MEVVDLPFAEREAWLDAHCPDPEMRRQVEALLAQYDERPTLLRGPGLPEGFDPDVLIGLPELPAATRVEEFEVIRLLGRGGMGVVYLARDTKLDRLVALKLVPRLMLPVAEGGPMHEARVAARLDHPGIVRVHRIGVDEGFAYIAMEYVEGPTLASMLKDRDAPFPVAEAIDIAIAVADALEHAHRREVVHRDVKPGNVLLDGGRIPRLTDFGIARDLAEPAREITRRVAGTLAYMSPEQARAIEIPVEAPSDVYSLGVVLYELLTNDVPYKADTAADLIRRMEDGPPRRIRSLARSVSKDLETVVHTALERDPRLRYQSAAAFAAELRAVSSGRPILARPPSLARRTRIWVRSHTTETLAASLLLAFGVIAMLIVQAVGAARRGSVPVIVTTDAPDAVGWIQRIGDDLEAEPPSRWKLGESGQRLAPGVFVLAVVAGDRFAETTVYVKALDESVDVHVPLSRDRRTPENMILIAGGDYPMGIEPKPGTENEVDLLLRPAVVRVEPFLIDAYEVTNAEYLEFVEATGTEAPWQWPDGGPETWPEGFASRPVVGVSQADAEAFARFHGKRLPSAREWAAAARGPDGWFWPWGPDAAAGPKPTEDMLRRKDDFQPDAQAAMYLEFTHPVDDRPQFATPRGVHGIYGNVREYTRDRLAGRPVVRGAWWGVDPAHVDLTGYVSPPVDSTSWRRGFRCARSVQPLFRYGGTSS